MRDRNYFFIIFYSLNINIFEFRGVKNSKKYGVDPDKKPEKSAGKIKTEKDAVRVYFWQAAGWGQWALVYGKMKAVKKRI